MEKYKIPIIISSCILIMILLLGYLFFHKGSSNSDIPSIHTNRNRGTVEASAVSPGAITKSVESSGNYTYIPPTYEYDDNNEDNKEDNMAIKQPTPTPWTPATEMDLEPTSITVFVNKEYCLPKNYVPENLVVPDIKFDTSGNSERKLMHVEAADAIEKLFAAALDDGITLYGISGYRSYSRQKEIFLNNIVHKGKKHTLKYSAAPGTSEHQTGLAMDVSSKSVRYKLIASFAKCKEGKWLADNAHKFGFIIRYPKNQYDITGYAYEPWHIRYVGEDLANYLYSNSITLEEYYNYVMSEGFSYEEKYADLINYQPPITPTPIPEEELDGEVAIDELTDEELENEGDGEPGDESSEVENLEGEDSEDENPEDEGSEGDNPEGEDSEDENPEGKDSGDGNPEGEDSEIENPIGEDSEIENPKGENSEGENPKGEDSENGNLEGENQRTEI